MFIAALFVIAKRWKQPKCLSIGKQINKMSYTVEYFSAFKKREVLTHAIILMNFEDITLSKVSQSQKDKYCTIPLISI